LVILRDHQQAPALAPRRPTTTALHHSPTTRRKAPLYPPTTTSDETTRAYAYADTTRVSGSATVLHLRYTLPKQECQQYSSTIRYEHRLLQHHRLIKLITAIMLYLSAASAAPSEPNHCHVHHHLLWDTYRISGQL